jgi:2-polyprenyl-3-methyl-5-hydroxy-6-metoxy-1,4-benzoquinol methylase
MSIDVTQRLSDATIGALELFAVHLGRELGLYDELDRRGPATAAELAERAGIDERYALEWLEQQAVAGYLVVDRPSADADGRRFALPLEHRGALVDHLDGDHVAPFAPMVVAIAQVLDEVVDAYREGSGVPYAHYGEVFRHGQGAINRPAFTADLVKAWIPAVEGLATRLSLGATVVDIGTGHGWSAIAVQGEWPAADVIGVDSDRASIDEARANAEQAGSSARFLHVGDDGADLATVGPIDVAFIMEALHDMAQPAEVLRQVRQVLSPDGIVVIADEAVAEAFTAPGDDLERMMYGWSITHCLPASRAEQPSAAVGTVIRPATVAAIAHDAGFGSCDIVDVDAGFFRIYRLSQ